MFTFLTVCWGGGGDDREPAALEKKRGRMSLNKCVNSIRLKLSLSVLRIIFKLGYFIDV